MIEPEAIRAEAALAAESEEIRMYVHDPSSRVVRSLLGNPRLTEEDVLIIANRKNVTPEILQQIAKEHRWSESYPIRLALARNPRSPLSVSLSVARFLRVFDLEEITRSHFIPLVLRRKVETIITERIPTMPPGNKKTLAKKAAGNVLQALLQDRIPEIVRLSLNNPNMLEVYLYKVISRPSTPLDTILMIADHPVWSRRPSVRYAIVRNPRIPLAVSLRCIQMMKLVDLRELYRDPSLPVSVRPIVHRALLERGIEPESTDREALYEIEEEEIADAERLAARQGCGDLDKEDRSGTGTNEP